jgi:hypothetical protein
MEMLVLDSVKESADQCIFTKLPNLLKKCCADIYNAEETNLFYCATLDASQSCKCAAVSVSKKILDCVTEVYCSDLSETNQWILWGKD